MVKKKVDDEEEMLFDFRAHRGTATGVRVMMAMGMGDGNARAEGIEEAITIFQQIFTPCCSTQKSRLKRPTGGL